MTRLTARQIEVLALRALIRLEQVRGRKRHENACVAGAATVLATMATKSKPGLSLSQTQRAIVATCHQMERLSWLTPDMLDMVAREFESAPGRGQLIKPLVATSSFNVLLKAVRRVPPTPKRSTGVLDQTTREPALF